MAKSQPVTPFLTTAAIPESNALDLDAIRPRKQNRDANAGRRRATIAIDTETENGDIFLLADSEGRWLEHPDITFEKVAAFLLRHEGSWVFCYNLAFDAESILKLLPHKTLEAYRRSRKLEFEFGSYRIRYFPRRKLTITKNNHAVSLFDIAQFYDNKPLAEAYKENIKQPLNERYLQIKASRRIFSKRFYNRNKKAVRQYCIDDCLLTKALAENWIDTFHSVFGFYPQNWISSGYASEKALIWNKIEVPFFHELPYGAQSMARAAFYGGRFELIQRGYIGECYLYDINSAYPYALTTLPNLLQGRWIESTKINPKASVGFFRILADVGYDVKIAPFPFRTKDNRIIYPCGRFKTYVTLDELASVQGDRRIKYKILESWQFLPDRDCSYPFRQFIEEQYYRRLALKEAKNPLERAIKIVLNSIYGKTAQRTNNVIGNLFCPAIAAYITGFTRAQLYRFMRENNLEGDIVAFATDSIACRKNIAGLDSKKLGEMKLDKAGSDVYFLSNGFYRFDDKWKRRGIGYDYEKKVEIEHLDTKIGDDGQLYIGVTTTKTMHIKSGIIYNKLKDINKIVEYEKHINLNSDKKRFWAADLQSLTDRKCCDSLPINASLVADVIAKKSDITWREDEEAYEPESDL